MFQLKFTVFISVILVSALYTTNIQAAIQMAELKTAFKNFFNGLANIANFQVTPTPVVQARQQYDSCAEEAASYDELVTCAQALYPHYAAYVGAAYTMAADYLKIIQLRSSFSQAILSATPGAPAQQQLIPIQGFTEMANKADLYQMRKASEGPERI